MVMEILGKILGNPARVKIMKMFLLNKGKGFKVQEVARRSRVGSNIVRREIRLLASVGFIKKRSSTSLEWFFNYSFKYGQEFEELLVRSDTVNPQAILSNFKNIGRIKLLITSGVFINNTDSRVDMLIVGDHLKRNRIEEGMRKLEAEIGIELVYAVFETKEFLYRLSMYDKLVRDILDFQHEVLVQAKDLSQTLISKTSNL
jgi:hypothetical protein